MVDVKALGVEAYAVGAELADLDAVENMLQESPVVFWEPSILQE